MSFPIPQPSTRTWDLPPLILHPFNERSPPSELLENSRAALMLSGMLPGDGSDAETLQTRLLTGRYAEVRMLFFLGRDLLRWVEQCMDCARSRPLAESGPLQPQSFARLLATGMPKLVRDKLIRWGVTDHTSIFTRAIGLNCIFTEPPAMNQVALDFLRNYHRYADAMYRTYLDTERHAVLTAESCQFELYASAEYSRMLESQWSAE